MKGDGADSTVTDANSAFSASTGVSSQLCIVSTQDKLDQALSSFRASMAHEPGALIWGAWRVEYKAPLAGFQQFLSGWVSQFSDQRPEVLHRYRRLLKTLLPDTSLPKHIADVKPFHAGLSDFVRHRDGSPLREYFRRREITHRIIADLVRLILNLADATTRATGQRVVIAFVNVERADRASLLAISLLARYANPRCFSIWVGGLTSEPLLEALNPTWAGWHQPSVPVPAPETQTRDTLHSSLDARAYECLAILAAAAAPLTTGVWAELVGIDEGSLRPQVDAWNLLGVIDGSHISGWHLWPGRIARQLAQNLSIEQRAKLSCQLLKTQPNLQSPLVAYHASLCGDREREYSALLDALIRSWSLGIYDQAHTDADRVIELRRALNRSEFNDQLLRAMLAYEAGDHAITDFELRSLLGRAAEAECSLVDSGENDDTLLIHLIGHNAVFGLGQFKEGIECLKIALSGYEQAGMERHASYVRNALAFALFRTQSLDKVIQWEKDTLEGARRNSQRDTFIEGILRLNLSRLYYLQGDVDQAIEYVKNVLADPSVRQTAALLLLYHSKLAHYYLKRQDFRKSLAEILFLLDWCPTIHLDELDQSLLANLAEPFHKQVGPVGEAEMLHGDRALLYLHYNLGIVCAKLGLTDLARATGQLVSSLAQVPGRGLAQKVLEIIEREILTAAPAAAEAATAFEYQSLDNLGAHEALLEQEATPQTAARLLREQKVLVWIVPKSAQRDFETINDFLVLFDPRDEQSARVTSQLRGGADTCVALPAARELFVDKPAVAPYAMQPCQLRPELKTRFGGVGGSTCFVRIVTAEWDSALHDVLLQFYQETGCPFVSGAPFRGVTHDEASGVSSTLRRFMESSFEHLYFGRRYVQKRYGADAKENLYSLYPKLCNDVRLYSSPQAEASNSFYIVAEPQILHRTPKFYKFNARLRTLVENCDGQHTVAEILQRVQGELDDVAGLAHRSCDLLRTMRQQGLVQFL
jgi:tetratricopeptide (TPR) repeat protein